jgi:heptosyltransferase-2
LVIRLDRLGDVVLSTPVLHALRQAYPDAFLAMMVRPACRELIEGHPALNEVLLYEKDGAHHGIGPTMRFARSLRRLAFDTAIILHPTRRSHWVAWLAGIPVRIGYARKGAWLLTHRLAHRKQEGTQHESRYTLELLTPLGISVGDDVRPFVPVAPGALERVEHVLSQEARDPARPLVAVHPSASCPSKRWLPERFAQVADRLIQEHHVAVCLVAGEADADAAHQVAAAMRERAIVLAGRLTVGELAALLTRCRLLVSNDSGPVHIAAAVGTPVVAIFGRNQPGLSATRWGPLGQGHIVLQKDVGCVTCLAHRCDIGFLCLSSLSVEEVFRAAASILHPQPVGSKPQIGAARAPGSS